MLILCLSCMQNKEEFEHFKKWRTDKSKSRRCDHCDDDKAVKKKLELCKSERKARQGSNNSTPLLVGLSKDEKSEKACYVRNRLADIKQQKIDDDFIGL